MLDTLRFALEERKVHTVTECRVERAAYRREGRNAGFYVQTPMRAIFAGGLFFPVEVRRGEKNADLGGLRACQRLRTYSDNPLPALELR